MSDSVRPHRRQPTRRLLPWDSPGKNNGVDCHFLLQCMKVKSESEIAQSCPTLSDPMLCSPPGCSVHGIFQARVLEWGAIAFSASLLCCAKILGQATPSPRRAQRPSQTTPGGEPRVAQRGDVWEGTWGLASEKWNSPERPASPLSDT